MIGFGSIKAQSRVWVKPLGFDKPSQTISIQEIGAVDISFADVVSDMKAFAASINDQLIS